MTGGKKFDFGRRERRWLTDTAKQEQFLRRAELLAWIGCGLLALALIFIAPRCV